MCGWIDRGCEWEAQRDHSDSHFALSPLSFLIYSFSRSPSVCQLVSPFRFPIHRSMNHCKISMPVLSLPFPFPTLSCLFSLSPPTVSFWSRLVFVRPFFSLWVLLSIFLLSSLPPRVRSHDAQRRQPLSLPSPSARQTASHPTIPLTACCLPAYHPHSPLDSSLCSACMHRSPLRSFSSSFSSLSWRWCSLLRVTVFRFLAFARLLLLSFLLLLSGFRLGESTWLCPPRPSDLSSRIRLRLMHTNHTLAGICTFDFLAPLW
jgi:hypothetical protein